MNLKLVKYCKSANNIVNDTTEFIQLGSVQLYRKFDSDSDVSDVEEGFLIYKIDFPVSITKEIMTNYFSNMIGFQVPGLMNIKPGPIDITISCEIKNGKEGIEFHPIGEKGFVRLDVTNLFLIYSLVDSSNISPNVNLSKRIHREYDSCYQITDLNNFIQAIAKNLSAACEDGSLQLISPSGNICSKININAALGMVDYSTPKYEAIQFNNNTPFLKRALSIIFNKNTTLDHDYQNEFRIVFYFTTETGDLLVIQNEKILLPAEGLRDFVTNVELF